MKSANKNNQQSHFLETIKTETRLTEWLYCRLCFSTVRFLLLGSKTRPPALAAKLSWPEFRSNLRTSVFRLLNSLIMKMKQVFTSMTLLVKIQPYKAKRQTKMKQKIPLKNTYFWSQSIKDFDHGLFYNRFFHPLECGYVNGSECFCIFKGIERVASSY